MPRLLVLLLGPVGAGKSHLARDCAAKTGGIVLPFAREVYRLAEAVLNRPVDKARPGDRELLKAIGTAWGREGTLTDKVLKERLDRMWSHPTGYADVWVDSFIRNVNSTDPSIPIFNDDTRFPNELTRAVGELEFSPFFVYCSVDTRLARLRDRGEPEPETVEVHKSERMNTLLSKHVLAEPLLPVIWNDPSRLAPEIPWIITVDRFYDRLLNNKSLVDWCHSHLRLAALRNLIGGERCSATSTS